ncbi:MAG: hypothetical protein ACLTSX_09815 [Collinsella sp.]
MKKAIGYALICAASLALSLGLGGCGKTATQGSGAPTAEEQPRTQTDHIKIEGMYTNDGYNRETTRNSRCSTSSTRSPRPTRTYPWDATR